MTICRRSLLDEPHHSDPPCSKPKVIRLFGHLKLRSSRTERLNVGFDAPGVAGYQEVILHEPGPWPMNNFTHSSG